MGRINCSFVFRKLFCHGVIFFYWTCSVYVGNSECKVDVKTFPKTFQELFGYLYSVKGINVHECSTWQQAKEHCGDREKELFDPKDWKDVKDILTKIKQIHIPLPVRIWTNVKIGSVTKPYFKNRPWLNGKIKINIPEREKSTNDKRNDIFRRNFQFRDLFKYIYPDFYHTEEEIINARNKTILRNITLNDRVAIEFNAGGNDRNIEVLILPQNTKLSFFCRRYAPPIVNPTTLIPNITKPQKYTPSQLTNPTKSASPHSTTPIESNTTTSMSNTSTSEPLERTSHVKKETPDTTEEKLKTTEEIPETTEKTLQPTEDTLKTTEETSKTTVKALKTTVDTTKTTEDTLNTTEDTLNATKGTLNTTKDTLNTTKDTLNTTEDTLKTTKATTEQTSKTTEKTSETTKETPETTEDTLQITEEASKITEDALNTSYETSETTAKSPDTTEKTLQTSETTDKSPVTTEETLQTTEDTSKTTEETLKITNETSDTTEETLESTETITISNTTSSIHTTSSSSNPTPTSSTASSTNDSCTARKTWHDGVEIKWPETDFNQIARPSCPRGTYGVAVWNCSSATGDFLGKPYVTCKTLNCSDLSFQKTENNSRAYMSYIVERLAQCGNDDDEVEARDLFRNIRMQRKNYTSRQSWDLEGTNNMKRMKQDMNTMLGMYDRLLDKNVRVWRNMKEDTRRTTSMEIIKETEETAWLIGCSREVATMKKDNLAVEIFQLNEDEKIRDLKLTLSSTNVGSVQLPGNLRGRTQNVCGKPMQKGIVAAYKNIESFLNPDNSRVNITSGIIGVSLDLYCSTYALPNNETVRIVLYHDPKPPDATAVCVFLNWNYTEVHEKYGVWDDAGCAVSDESTDDYTVCKCNHLTNFAVLMDFTGNKYSDMQENILSCLSAICCSLSSVALLLTIIIYATVKSLRSRRSTITCNLAICLLGMNILVQTGLERVTTTTDASPVFINKGSEQLRKVLNIGSHLQQVCKMVSAVLQYFVLSAFSWMMLEGVLLYRMVILVFETNKIRLRMLYSIAYGIPFLIVTLSSAVDTETMIREKYCWPSTEKGHIWSVIGPIVLIITVNLIVFCMTLNAASKIDKLNSNNNPSFEERKRTLKQRLKGMLSLMCLLGFTWTVGFFYVPQTPIAAYLFVTVNGLQGVFLFVTQMILNDHARRKLFAIYKENFARFTSVTSSWNLIGTNSKNHKSQPGGKTNPEEKKKPKGNKEEFSNVCTSQENQGKDVHAPKSHLELSRIPVKIIELAKETKDIHPFGLNYESA